MNLFREESSNPKYNAQRNLCGRTHYVDDDTLKFHKSRILETHITDNGLLFALVESVAVVMDGSQRRYRPVIFDTFGTTLSRVNLEDCHKTRKAAVKAMWATLNSISGMDHTLAAISEAKASYAAELDSFANVVAKFGRKVA